MANNELSGPLLANYLYKSLKDLKYKTNLSYRFLLYQKQLDQSLI